MLAAAVCLAAAAAPERPTAPPPVIVCTTTHLSALVETLGGGGFRVETIVAWGMCPGHFELKRGDIENIRGAGLLLGHGYEKFLSAFDDNRSYAVVAVPGNWMIPAIQKKAAERTAVILAERFPRNADTIRANLAAYRSRIDALENELRPLLEKMKATPAACSSMCADFALWAGLAVAAEFQRDEDLSLRNLQDVIQKARSAGACMVIDNRQSSGKTGQTLARELAAPLVMLGNFPEPGADGHYSYEATLKKNVLALSNGR